MNCEMICKQCGCVIEDEASMITCEDGSVFCSEDCAIEGGYKKCENCGEWVPTDADDTVAIRSHVFCSEDCANEFGYYRCDHCGQWVTNMRYIENTCEHICIGCYVIGEYFRCDHCDGYFSEDALGLYNESHTYCDNCSDDYLRCEDCDEILHYSNAVEIDGNYYCSDCAEDHSHGSDLHDYGYKPLPVFYGEKPNEDHQLFIGVELEVDDGEDANYLCGELEDYEEIYCKHDGSLGDEGVEIVSHPCTLDYHMHSLEWAGIMAECITNNYASHNAGTCGLHTHVNRTFFGDTDDEQDLNIAKVVLLVNRFFDSHIVPFSRRKHSQLDNWAKKNTIQKIYSTDNDRIVSQKVKVSKNSGRYQAVNLQNRNTIEFRVFRGTLKYSTFIATLQFVDTICRFAKRIRINDIDNTKWEDIFVGTDWPELNVYPQERTDFSPEKIEKLISASPNTKPRIKHEYTPIKDRNDVEVGDRIIIREWDDMKNEFGLNLIGNINCDPRFITDMEYLCGAIGTVTSRSGIAIEILFDGNMPDIPWSFSTDMIDVIG